MRTIRLNDGTVYHVTMCGDADGYLWISLKDEMTMVEAVSVFGNAEKTEVIHHAYGENDMMYYEGYTELVRIENHDGMTITLKKG